MKNIVGYFYALKGRFNEPCIQMNSPIFSIEVEGVDTSDMYFVKCPFCNHNITFLLSMGNCGLQCSNCNGQLWGPMLGIDII